MFEGKAEAHPSEAPDQAGKAYQGQTLELITDIHNLRPGTNVIKLFTSVIYECS